VPRCAGLAKLFKSIDADGSGTITVEELRKALQDWGHRISDVSMLASPGQHRSKSIPALLVSVRMH
jgi:hypothetical protein